MLKYRNKVTGAVVETDCRISGEQWELVEQAGEESPATPSHEPQEDGKESAKPARKGKPK